MIKTYRIDLFSDTNTNPSPEMRQAMCEAVVGNEVAGEDPTVNILLDTVCQLLGKEAAVFLPSGTMCNGVAYRVFCDRPGDWIILDKTAHPVWKSAGLISGLVQAQPYLVEGKNGIFSASQVETILSLPQGYNVARSRVVSVEQSTNLGGGTIWPLETIEEVCHLAHFNGAFTHMDGARLLNAVAETSIPAAEYAHPFDSVWIDFSKSLGAPMGAVLAGSKGFIDRAWYYKFQQGGGMHQAGILAAGCLYGLTYNLERIPEIHAHAKNLANLLSELPFCKIPVPVQTNVLIVETSHTAYSAWDIARYLQEKSIRVLALDDRRIRMMTHLDISSSDIQSVFQAIRDLSLVDQKEGKWA